MFAIPGFPNIDLPSNALISTIVRMILGYFFDKLRKNYPDVSM
jgi:hypothetical protein